MKFFDKSLFIKEMCKNLFDSSLKIFWKAKV
jgi:hypothetical protein